MTLKEVGVVVGVVLATALVFNCHGKRSVSHDQAVDSFKTAVRISDSVSAALQPQIAAWRDSASRLSGDADSLRRMASRLAARNGTSASPANPPLVVRTGSGPLVPDTQTTVQRPAFDSLAQAYDLMVRVDSLNHVIIAQKDSIIGADSVMIAALQATRVAAREAVKAQTCRVLGFIPCPSRNTVALVSLGLGVVAGYEIARH